MSITPQQAQEVFQNSEQLFDAAAISKALDQLANNISNDLKDDIFQEQPIIVMSVMNGGLILAGHLLTRLGFPLTVDFIHATRYRNKTSGGELEWKVEPHQSIEGRTLLILDDILDEGHTLDAIVRYCKEKGAAKIITAVLVEKLHDRRHANIKCDHVGLQVDDRYVFGFGMDFKGYHRNLNGVYAASENDY